jgi:hypothetical protein
MLYSLFRRYGKLAEITSQASDSKVLPKFAYLDFARMRHAIMARNCMHGIKILEAEGGGAAGTELRLSYEQKMKTHWSVPISENSLPFPCDTHTVKTLLRSFYLIQPPRIIMASSQYFTILFC